jgi:hypothetical protein
MSRIESMFEKGKKIFQTKMTKITKVKLQTYSTENGISMDKYFLKDGKYTVPGLMILDRFRETVERLHNEDNEFPIAIANNMTISCGSTVENRILIGEELIFRAQVRHVSEEKNFRIALCRVEISRGGYIVFAGMFHFYQGK